MLPNPMSDYEPQTTYFCIDIEANGPVPSLYDMVSLGAVVVYADDKGTLHIGNQLYLEIRPQAPRFDARAADIHGLDQERLMKEGLPRPEFCRQLSTWVHNNTKPNTRPTFVGHNAPFDWSFVAWTFSAENMPNPFGYKALCTKSLGQGVLDLHWNNASKDTMSEILKLPTEDHVQKHRADYDAYYQALLLIELLKRMESLP